LVLTWTTWTTTSGPTTSATAIVLRAAALREVRRLVYASSMVVYGEGAYECPRHGPAQPTPVRRKICRPAVSIHGAQPAVTI
jgi:nucleoside-diphosphate-sugar epimerase